MSIVLLLAAGVRPSAAAGGTYPTLYSTSKMTCRNDAIASVSSIDVERPVMQTAGTYFNGYFAASTKLQYSADGGNTWHAWKGTKQSHGLTRVYGSGVSAFLDRHWGPWTLPALPDQYVIRARTTFRWLDRHKDLIAKRVRLGDYYKTIVITPENPLGDRVTSSAGCILWQP